ncbi:hypothetical protein E2C01_042913 [Portunus trituberculatus]|uniref:RNA-directed DNA polymerase from mobile element jockey n=1 Tax=Portunus trituberculatus TaxID=210409 RepID=A0A5B7FN43_PORTR|nr:hypothetical protein [Portunus trituberculatus]
MRSSRPHSTGTFHEQKCLHSALLRKDEDDEVPITEDELRRTLARSKATAPGNDGVIYQVLRHLKVPGNPLLQLYNLCFRRRYVPRAWTSSIIVPIPKPATDRFRPISLLSCFCNVFERIFLSRLMFRLQDKLSPRLYACGLILSPHKSRIFSPKGPGTLPAVFIAGHSVIPPCTQYLYLGAPVHITPGIPARQRVHPIIQDLLHRLNQRFVPFKWLVNNTAGISIPCQEPSTGEVVMRCGGLVGWF